MSLIFNQRWCLTLQYDGKEEGVEGLVLVHVGLASPIEEQMKEKTKKNRKPAVLLLEHKCDKRNLVLASGESYCGVKKNKELNC